MFKKLWLIFICSIAIKALTYHAILNESDYCKGHDLGDFVANPYDCKLFFWCGENKEAVLAACPLNMLFNPQTKLCDHAESVQCKPEINATTSAEIVTLDNPAQTDLNCFNFNSYAVTFLPHPHNCQQYYMCYRGQVLLLACSPKLHWNSRLAKCDLPFNAGCLRPAFEEEKAEEEEEDESVEVLPSLDETPIWTESIKCPLDGQHIFPNIKHCGSFIFCVKGQAVLQICPFYQFFDVESARCQWRPKATCIKDLNMKYYKRNF